MNITYLFKIAKTNIKNNIKMYIPYILTCIGSIMLFYNMMSIYLDEGIKNSSLKTLLSIGVGVTGIFLIIFLFYTNSFLIRRRKKEFGLFNLLGMNKSHISIIIFYETLIIGFLCIFSGLFVGVLFNKLFTLILLKIMHTNLVYSFYININALTNTLIFFTLIFLVICIDSVVSIYRSNNIELLKASNVKDKEPKTKWISAIAGFISLFAGYFIANRVGNPVEAMMLFFLAVILVIMGTYLLFSTGSVVLFKYLKSNKNYYYKTNHFVSVSNLLYRVNKNAMGLANICIMSTAVLVIVSTTTSLYFGMNDVLSYRYPNDVLIEYSYDVENRNDFDVVSDVNNIVKDVKIKDYKAFEKLSVSAIKRDGYIELGRSELNDISGMMSLTFMSSKDYNDNYGENITLGDGEVAIISKFNTEKIVINDLEYNVKQHIDKNMDNTPFDNAYVIVNNTSEMDKIYIEQLNQFKKYASKLDKTIIFNFDGLNNKDVINKADSIIKSVKSLESATYLKTVDVKQLNIESFYNIYGGLFYIGVFLGVLFLGATVSIIYYKQIIEGLEDKERYKIMIGIGMSQEEIKKIIDSQVLTIFSSPIIMAIIHLIFAFGILVKLLKLLNLVNINLFVICTILSVLVFVVIYIIVYKVTSKMYYKIINE